MLKSRYDEKIGEGLVRIGALNSGQREEILRLQQQGDKRLFGQIAVARHFVTPEAVTNYLKDIRRIKSSRRYW